MAQTCPMPSNLSPRPPTPALPSWVGQVGEAVPRAPGTPYPSSRGANSQGTAPGQSRAVWGARVTGLHPHPRFLFGGSCLLPRLPACSPQPLAQEGPLGT